MIAVLISCTIVGLPVGILMFLLWPVLVYAGQVSATYVLGCKLLRRRLGEGPALPPVMAGSLLIALFFAASIICFNIGGLGGPFALFFGLVGSLVLGGLTTIGTGALLLSRFGSRERAEHASVPGAIPVAGILP